MHVNDICVKKTARPSLHLLWVTNTTWHQKRHKPKTGWQHAMQTCKQLCKSHQPHACRSNSSYTCNYQLDQDLSRTEHRDKWPHWAWQLGACHNHSIETMVKWYGCLKWKHRIRPHWWQMEELVTFQTSPLKGGTAPAIRPVAVYNTWCIRR